MIVLVAGLPGSGKSYFASKLAENINAVYVSSDQVRRSIGAEGKYSAEDKLAVYKEMVKIAARAVDMQKVVVADATFYRKAVRDLFIRLANEKAAGVRVIWVQAEESLIKERLRKPRKDSEADFRVYELLRDQFEPIAEPHLKLKSTNTNIATLLNKAREYILSTHD